MKQHFFTLKIISIIVLTLAALLYIFHLAPFAQPLSYHNFADQRTLLGIPNFWDVISNAGFLLVGFIGLKFLIGNKKESSKHFQFRYEKTPYFCFFLGSLLIAIGSSYYHWNPNNATLVWDRLPMTIAFTAFTAALISDYINIKAGQWLLFPLIATGIFSVFYWAYTESIGRGDLRLYGFVQFYPMVLVLIMLIFFKNRYTGARYILMAFAWYAFAKILEALDKQIYALTHHLVSGHALKHLAAAMAMYVIYLYIKRREVVLS